MRKSKKQLLRTLMACGLVVSVAAGGTVAYLTDAETATNTFTVGKVKIDLEEPGYPGNDSDEVKNIIPNQEIVKDPQIENTGNNDALVFLRVEVPQEEFTELDANNNVGEKKLQDLFKLKNVSDQWELLRTETTTDADGKTKTSYVYGYKMPLAKGSTTDKLFQKVQMKNSIEKDLEGNVEDVIVTACAIQATDIPDVNLKPGSDGTLGKDVLDQVYTIFLNQSGDQTSRPADEGDRNQTGKLGKISYELDGGTLADGSLTEYGSADYGYTPPEPTKEGFAFAGWEPQSIPAGSTGNVTLTAKWTSTVLGTISYNLDGGSMDGGKNSYTADDYGYVPPIPTKRGFEFTGWSPSNIPVNSRENVTFTAQWKEVGVATLLDGPTLNSKLKSLSGDGLNEDNDYMNSAIKAIQQSTTMPSANVIQDSNALISASGSDKAIYAWFEDGIIKWWSETSYIEAGNSLSKAFFNMNSLTDISGLKNINTSNVTDMSALFSGEGQQLSDITPLSGWDVSNVTNMRNMFGNCCALSNINALADWNTKNVTNMEYMFYNCNLTDLTPLENWTVDNVTNIGYMFAASRNLMDLTPLESWKTNNIANMNGTFFLCENLVNLTPLTNWMTGNVTTMDYMFSGCTKLIDVSAINDWDITNVTNFKQMFYQCSLHPEFSKKAGTWDNGTFTPTT